VECADADQRPSTAVGAVARTSYYISLAKLPITWAQSRYTLRS